MTDQPKALLQRLERLGQDGVGNYGMPICAEAAAELRRLVAENERLHQINQSHEMKLSVRGYEIQIEDLRLAHAELRERNAELLEALVSFTKSGYIKKQHPKRYAAAVAAIAKAEKT